MSAAPRRKRPAPLLLILPLFLLLLGLAGPAWALESAAVTSPRATVSLVTDADSVAPGHPFRVGLRLRLAPGWHTYWKNPGDAGDPATLALTLPKGAEAGPIEWPAPRRIVQGGVGSYGYTGDVLLPLTVTPPASGGPVSIEAHATWLVCADLCVPEQGSFRLDLPAGPGAPSAQAGLFAASDKLLPRPSPFGAQVAPDGTLTLTGEGLGPDRIADAQFFPDSPDALVNAAPQPVSVRDGVLSLRLKPAPAFRPAAGLSGVVILRDPRGEATALSVTAAPGPDVAEPAAPGLWQALGLAFLGGLVLNLMPCVFPVLAMKAMALARLSGTARREVRAHAASYTAGVLLAFLALGGVMLGLRAAGQSAGWGFQFQSPAFVAAMAWVLFAVGLNLSGVFGLGGYRLAGAGQGMAARGGHAGSFFTGLLAVLVATPCTAPFMGAAVAASVAAPAPVTLGVFLALGLGLAAPYAALALAPRLAGLLPRPGAWMELLRQGLAFPMYAASAWLLWVVSQEAGPSAVLATAAGLVLLGFAGWVLGRSQLAGRRWRRTGGSVALATVLLAAALLPGIAAVPQAVAPAAAADSSGAQPFSAARLARLRAEGRPVFVDMTAAWCVTCLVNERVALAPQAVRIAFAAGHVVYLKGDWTRQDPEITAFLRRHGRDGVPLYVFYPAHGDGMVLPQILTAGMVLRALRQAGT